MQKEKSRVVWYISTASSLMQNILCILTQVMLHFIFAVIILQDTFICAVNIDCFDVMNARPLK